MEPTHSTDEVSRVLALEDDGCSPREISALTGVPVGTIRTWRRRGVPRRAQRELGLIASCPSCGAKPHRFEELPPEPYAYLLGLYLGDGSLRRWGRSWILRIACDAAYPGIIAHCCEAIASVHGDASPIVKPEPDKRCVRVESTWKQWPCLFPQHGPGRKHQREIALVPWQRTIVEAETGGFLRGLIHSDGWRGTNRVCVKGKRYEYPRYQFSNRSADIRRLFTDACDRLGVSWRPWTRFHISVAKAASVARLDEVVGPKS